MISVRVIFNTSKRYPNNSTYAYLVPKEWKVEKGDNLVVDSPNCGMVCVTVVEICNRRLDKAKIRAVCKLDTTEYDSWKDREIRIRDLEKEIDERANYVARKLAIEELSKKDNKLMSLLKELKSLF